MSVYISPLTSLENCHAFIQALDSSLMKLGMTRITVLLEALGNPQDSYKTIHVMGTNGKGSTCAMLESVYRTAGYTTGLFTSPHLIDMRERIKINNLILSDSDFINIFSEAYNAMITVLPDREDWLTYFEFITVMGFLAFKVKQVDIAIIEAGLGGRLDGTNVIRQPEAIVVTNISLDHQHILGETLEEIATEKAGVFRSGSPVITSVQEEVVQETLIEHANAIGCSVLSTDSSHVLSLGIDSENGLNTFETPIGELSTNMLGRYQALNIATVLTVISHLDSLPVSNLDIIKGLNAAQWPARLQWLRDKKIIIDGSHNISGVKSLVYTLEQDFADFNISLGLSLLKTKRIDALAPLLFLPNISQCVLLTGLPPKGGAYYTVESLETYIQTQNPELSVITLSLEAFLNLELTKQNALKLLTGSLYTAGEALKTVPPLCNVS